MSFPFSQNSHLFIQRVLLNENEDGQLEQPGHNESKTSTTIGPNGDDVNKDQSGYEEYSLLHDVTTKFHNQLNNDNVLLPVPDWPTALKEWGVCWDIHVYGCAILFMILTILSASIFIRFRARVLRFQIVLNTLVLLATSGLFRAMFLLIDAYGHQERMTRYLVGIMTQAVYPLLCACYGLTQVMLVKVTNVDVGPSKFRSLSSLLGCTLGYLFLVVVVESIVYYERHLKLLLMVDSGCFIAWALYLTITFVCSGFRLSQYTNETKKARKELNAFSSQRRTASNTNALSTISNSSNDTRFSPILADSTDVTPTPDGTVTDFSGETTTSNSFPSSSSCSFSNYAQQNKASTIRLSRTKMKISDHNHMTIALVTDDDDQSTSSTDVEQSSQDARSLQKLNKITAHGRKKRPFKSRKKAEYKTKHDAAVDRLLSTPNNDNSSPHADKVVGDKQSSRYRSVPTEENSKLNGSITGQTIFKPKQNFNVTNEIDNRDPFSSRNKICDMHLSSNASIGPIHAGETRPNPEGFHTNIEVVENNVIEEININDCDWSKSQSCDAAKQNDEIVPDIEILSSSIKDNGYLADTENVISSTSAKRTNRRLLRSSSNALTEEDSSSDQADISDCEDNDAPLPLALSDAPSNIGLFRIRQSKMVQRAVHLTYFLTFLFMFACLMQLYTVFGVYGVLGKVLRPLPWPWFFFHTIFRLLECSIGFTCAAIAFITLNHRHQRAKRRLQQHRQISNQQQQQQQEFSRKSEYQEHFQDEEIHHPTLEQHSPLMNTRECVV